MDLMRAEWASGVSAAPRIDRDTITTPEDLTMAAEAYQRGYVAVKEEGRQEGWRAGARAKEVDMLCELLLPAVGSEFADELRALLGDDELRARLDPNIVFDLRLQYDTNPEELQQALRDRLKT
jgi:hypothetical protein